MRGAAVRFLFAVLICLGGCHRKEPPLVIPNPAQHQATTPQEVEAMIYPAQYWADCRPFEPTLAHLFSEGRAVVLPDEAVTIPPETYAFSAVDRFGNVYDFDTAGRWVMQDGAPLPAPLPAGQWDSAWNPLTRSLEVLVTAPYTAHDQVQILRRRGGRWLSAPLMDAPPARVGAMRLYSLDHLHWSFLGGSGDGQAWRQDVAGWKPGLPGDKLTTGTLETGPVPNIPAAAFCASAPDGGLALLTRQGEVWLRRDARWSREGTLPVTGLWLFKYLPDRRRVLAVWRGGHGRHRAALLALDRKTPAGPDAAEDLDQTRTIRVNDEETGLWTKTGRLPKGAKAKDARALLAPDDPRGDAWAVLLDGGHEEAQVIAAADIKMIELPPSLDDANPDAAAYAPRLGGLVLPTLTMKTAPRPRSRMLAQVLGEDAGTTIAGLQDRPVEVIERGARFWVFRGDEVEWLQSPSDLNPLVGHPATMSGPGGARRMLAWDAPQNGTFRFEYVQHQDDKIQWMRSPLLTLDKIVQQVSGPPAPLHLLEPRAVGEPGQVAVIGWSGELGAFVTGGDERLGGYSEVPHDGFMARIDALKPEQWVVDKLPMRFISGAKTLVGPDGRSVLLVGGRAARENASDSGLYYEMRPNLALWRWTLANGWQIVDSKEPPVLGGAFDADYDPRTGQLMTLSDAGFYGFLDGVWQRHADPPDEAPRYPAPASWRLLIGGGGSETIAALWPAGNHPATAVWGRNHWVPVRWPAREDGPYLAGAPADGIPALERGGFVLLDRPALARWRLDEDAPAQSDAPAAYWLQFSPEPPRGGALKPDTFKITAIEEPAPTPAAHDAATSATLHQ